MYFDLSGSVSAIIRGLFVLAPLGGQKGQLTQFNVSLSGSTHQTDFGAVHFTWTFGDEVT